MLCNDVELQMKVKSRKEKKRNVPCCTCIQFGTSCFVKASL